MIRTAALALPLLLLGASPQAAPVTSQAPGTFTITFSSIPPDGVLYEWDFDYRGTFLADYTDVIAGDVSFTYTAIGFYTARLLFTDDQGGQTPYDVPVNVAHSSGPPNVQLVPLDFVLDGDAPAISVRAFSALNAALALYQWDVDDDGTFDQSGPTLSTVTFPARPVGSYPFRVVVTDTLGAATTLASSYGVVNTLPAQSAPPPVVAAGPPPSADLPNITAFSATTGGTTTSILGGKLPTFNARVGDLVTCDVSADAGAIGVMSFFRFDFDGRNGVTQFDLTMPGSAAAESVVATQHYDAPGTYTVTLRVQDSEGWVAVRTATVNVSVEPGIFKTWLFRPRSGQRVFGDAVTLRAKTFPTSQTAAVTFFYRPLAGGAPPPTSDPSWIPIKTVTPPPFTFLSTTWDVTGLPPGDYDLAAVATRTLGGAVDSLSNERVVITVDPAGPEILENVATDLNQGIDPNRNESTGLSGDVIVDIPAGATLSYDQMRIQRRSLNPHPLESRLQGLNFLSGQFRKINFDGGLETLNVPSRVTFYVSDQNDDGFVDGSAISKTTLKVYRFNPLLKAWQPLGEQVLQPQEDLVRATLQAVGDVGIAGQLDTSRAPAGTSSDCGLLGAEALLAAWAVARLLRRRR